MIDLMKYKFDEIIEDCTKYGLKIPTNDYLEKGKFPIIDQGQDFIAGYSNSDNGIYSDVPAIIFGDHTRIFKYVDFPFFLGADGVKILKARKEISYKYLFYYFLQAKFPNTGYARHYKWLKELEIPVPTIEKQNSIVNNLDKVTKIIKAHKILLEKYDTLIKSRFIEMFGDPIINTKSWNEDEFGNICILKAGKSIKANELSNKDKEHSYPCYGGNGIRGYIGKKSHSGNIVLIGRQGALCGNVQITNGDFYATEHAVVVTPKVEINSLWLYHLLYLMNLNRYKTGAAQPGLTVEKLNTVPVMIVPVKLQNDFAAFVQQIDKSKFAVQKSLEKAETLYKSLMQEYFG